MPGTDLGNDTGTATINATAKVVELFLALLEKIYEQAMRATDPEHRLEKAKFKEYKEEKAAKDLSRKLDSKGGYVSLRTLRKSGEPLEVFNLKGLEQKDIDRFKETCKREGVVYSGAYVKREDDKFDFNLVVRAKDLERIKAITERMNDEKRIEAIDQKIADIWKKPEVTEQDIANIRELQRQKAEIQQKTCAELNQQQAEIIMGNAVYHNDNKPITLDEALNRNTGRSLDKDVYTIVADSHDPSKYIRCHGFTDTYKGKEYIKTEYEVFSGGKKVLTTHDGRFDGRPKDYWDTQKAAIMQAGGFTGALFKFYSEAEYQRWAEYATRENTQELSQLTPGTSRTAEDYDKAIESLQSQLKEHNVSIGENGTLVMTVTENGEAKQTPLPSVLSPDFTPEQKSVISECHAIKSQIDVLTQMKAAESELTQAKAFAMVVDDNTPPEQKKIIEERVATAEAKLSGLQEKEAALYEQRKEINAVQADQNVTADRQQGRFEQAQTEVKPLEQEQTEGKAQTGAQHTDEMGRLEVVEQNEERQKTLEEWQAVVQDDRKKGAELETPEAQKGERQTGKPPKAPDRE